jgi:hypothetical protein
LAPCHQAGQEGTKVRSSGRTPELLYKALRRYGETETRYLRTQWDYYSSVYWFCDIQAVEREGRTNRAAVNKGYSIPLGRLFALQQNGGASKLEFHQLPRFSFVVNLSGRSIPSNSLWTSIESLKRGRSSQSYSFKNRCRRHTGS